MDSPLYCHKIQTKGFLRFYHILKCERIQTKKIILLIFGRKKKIYLYFYQLVVQVKTIHIFRYAYWVVWVDERLSLFSLDFQEHFKFGCSRQDCRLGWWKITSFFFWFPRKFQIWLFKSRLPQSQVEQVWLFWEAD